MTYAGSHAGRFVFEAAGGSGYALCFRLLFFWFVAGRLNLDIATSP
jgi:hypothetical protein